MASGAKPILLNWGVGSESKGYLLPRGETKSCITCKKPTFIINPEGRPQHKVCAERLAREAADA